MTTPLPSPRGRAMVERVSAAFARAGGAPEGRERLEAALGAALAGRERALGSDHDPRYLHPARTVLILLEDAGERRMEALVAAAFLETWTPALAPPGSEVASRFGPEAAALLEAARALGSAGVGAPSEEAGGSGGSREEALPAVLLAAARLDRLRHLHLEPDAELRRSEIAGFLPLRDRIERFLPDPLARRIRWWTTRVAPRL